MYFPPTSWCSIRLAPLVLIGAQISAQLYLGRLLHVRYGQGRCDSVKATGRAPAIMRGKSKRGWNSGTTLQKRDPRLPIDHIHELFCNWDTVESWLSMSHSHIHTQTDIHTNGYTICPQHLDMVPISLSQFKHTELNHLKRVRDYCQPKRWRAIFTQPL